MDERGWLACTDPDRMLRRLQGRAGDRKLRLFACGCCRRVWELLRDRRTRKAVEVAERFAEGQATWAELSAASRGACRVGWPDTETPDHAARAAAGAAGLYQAPDAPEPLGDGLHVADVDELASVAAWEARRALPGKGGIRAAEKLAQCALLRDLFGNPFRPAALDTSWRSADVLALAQAAYDNRTLPAGTLEPARLALLADALEDAGCDGADLLSHLRDPGPHVRGCWALDLLTGRG